MNSKYLYVVLFLVFPFILNGQSSNEKETTNEEEVFSIVEQMPEFPGGQEGLFQFLGSHTRYPKEAKANGITGKVYVSFTVGKDGLIRDIKVIKGVHPLLDAEAVRVVGVMPLWKPGTQKGKPVSVSYNLPFNFTLNNGKKKGESSEEDKDSKDKGKEGDNKKGKQQKGGKQNKQDSPV